MKRLLFIVMAIVLASSMLLAACEEPAPTPAPEPAPAPEPEPEPEYPIELSFSYHAPPVASLSKAVFVPWAEALEAASNGKLIVTDYPGGALLGAADAYDGVITGICDIAQVETEEYVGRFPRNGISMLPFIYPNTEIAAIVSHEIENKYCVDTELKDVKLLITAPLHQMHYLGNKPVEKLEDFKGMKMRSVGEVDAATIEAFGATPVPVAIGDLFTALDTGVVDGTFITWSAGLSFGLKDVTKYRTECGVFLTNFLVVMNKQVYESLPKELQELIDEFSTPEVSRKYAAEHMALEKGAKAGLEGSDKGAGNPPINILTTDELARWKEVAHPVWDEWIAEMEGEGLPGQAIIDDVLSLEEKYSQ
jgi:TRAP-type C4-dicarboxylate transport system substrate-binding protein